MVGGGPLGGLVYKKCSGGRGPAGGALFTRSVVVGGGLLVGPCLQEV